MVIFRLYKKGEFSKIKPLKTQVEIRKYWKSDDLSEWQLFDRRFIMCWCDIVFKSGANRLGQGLEGTLHFLAFWVLTISFVRLGVFWIFGL